MWPWSERRLPPPPGRSPVWRNLNWRPTRLGAGLLAVVALLWLLGANYQLNLAYAAAFWLVGFWLVAALMNVRQLLGMQIDVGVPQEVFAGGSAHLLLSQPDKRQRWLWVCNDDEWQQRPSESGIWQAWDSGGGQDFDWAVPAGGRGRLHVPPLRTAAIAPFGLTMVQCVWHWPSETLVYPAPLPHELPLAVGGGTEEGGGAALEGGDDVSHLQPHREGVSLQHVAWKTFAKTGALLDKRFEHTPPAAEEEWLSYRDYPPATPKERVAGLLCFRLLEAERCGRRYVLELPQQTVAPRTGQREICLAALALW